MKPVRFLDEALTELSAAAEWYDDHASLGEQVVASVLSLIEMIGSMPHTFSRVRTRAASVQARQAVVPRFPYRVVFVESDTEIRVVAIAHTRRRPGYWIRRID